MPFVNYCQGCGVALPEGQTLAYCPDHPKCIPETREARLARQNAAAAAAVK